MSVPFIPVCSMLPQYTELAPEILKATEEVLSSGNYILGPKVQAFESAIQAYLDGQECVGVANGTDALELALRALDLEPNDEVIIPGHSYPTTWGVLNAGSRVRAADIDKKTWSYSIASLNETLTEKTKVLVVVHLYGMNMLSDEIFAWAKKNNLFILEDCAQALSGQREDGSRVGTKGDISTFSFYPTKPLGAFGDGGLIATRNPAVAQKLRALRMYGETSRYNSTMIGTNSRLDELQAAYLLVKLPHLEKWRQERLEQAQKYDEAFARVPGLLLCGNPEKTRGSFHLYPIRTTHRQALQEYLTAHGIGSGIHYPLPLTKVPSLENFFGSTQLPEAEKHCAEVLSLPLYNGLTSEMQDQVITRVTEFFT